MSISAQDRDLGIVVAMAAEARALPRTVIARVDVCGPGPGRARAAAERLVDAGCTALLSFGVAAGLDPALRSGAVIVASAVRGPGESEPAPPDPDWCERLAARGATLRDVRTGTIVGVEHVVRTSAEKRELAALGCIADMESAAIAGVAHRRGVAWMALRAIVDAADVTLPRAALAGLGTDGRARPLAVARALLGRPTDLPALIALALAYRRARRALAAFARAAGPRLGAPTATVP